MTKQAPIYKVGFCTVEMYNITLSQSSVRKVIREA